MIDSRVKGRTAELKCRDELRKLTKLKWERTPMSGALDARHKMKGDVYIPGVPLRYCVEIKHYAEDHIDTKLITSKNPMFMQWWEQAKREAGQMNNEPLLVFKHNRSKWFAASTSESLYFSLLDNEANFLMIYPEEISVCLLTDFCKYEEFI